MTAEKFSFSRSWSGSSKFEKHVIKILYIYIYIKIFNHKCVREPEFEYLS